MFTSWYEQLTPSRSFDGVGVDPPAAIARNSIRRAGSPEVAAFGQRTAAQLAGVDRTTSLFLSPKSAFVSVPALT